MPIKSVPDWGECREGTRSRAYPRMRHGPGLSRRSRLEGHSASLIGMRGRQGVHARLRRAMSAHDEEGRASGLQSLQQVLRAGDVGLAWRILDVQRLHDAVVDHHGVALRASAEPAFAEIDRKADLFGKF